MKRFLGCPEPPAGTKSGVHSTRRFSEIIRNERARCDRYGRFFALVMFHVEDRKRNAAATRKWIRRLRGRIRPIDAMGWIDGNRLAVLLPGTTRSGAETFVENARRLGPSPHSGAAWNVFVYPCASGKSAETEAEENQAPCEEPDEQTLERN
jgi:GGDEF domain-containing protein